MVHPQVNAKENWEARSPRATVTGTWSDHSEFHKGLCPSHPPWEPYLFSLMPPGHPCSRKPGSEMVTGRQAPWGKSKGTPFLLASWNPERKRGFKHPSQIQVSTQWIGWAAGLLGGRGCLGPSTHSYRWDSGWLAGCCPPGKSEPKPRFPPVAAGGLQHSSSLSEVHLSALSLSPKRKEPLWEAAPLCSHTHKGKAAVSKEPASNSTPEPSEKTEPRPWKQASQQAPPAGSSVPVCLVGAFPRAHSGAKPTTCWVSTPSRDLTNWPWSLQDTRTSNHSLPGVTPRVPLLAWVGTHSELRVGINIILSWRHLRFNRCRNKASQKFPGGRWEGVSKGMGYMYTYG